MTRVMDIADTQVVQALARSRIIALAALDEPDQVERAGASLVRAGVTCVELATPRVGLLRAARRVDGLLVGAGNVHTVAGGGGPCGGIGPELLRSYLLVSSVLAVCSAGLVRPDLVRAGSYERIEWLAREAVRSRTA